MSAVLTPSTTTPPPSSIVTVNGTGFNDAKTRLLLDGVVSGPTICSLPAGTFTQFVTVSASVGSQTISTDQYVAGAWTQVATVNVTVTAAGSGTIRSIGPSTTSTQFKSYMASTAYDIIEMAAGTYHNFHIYHRSSPGAPPLLVRPAAGAAVVFDDTGGSVGGNGFLYLGSNVGGSGYPTNVTADITFDAAGTGGSFTIQNYNIGHTGLILTGWVDNIVLNGFIVRNCVGSGGSFSHCLYVNSDGDTGHAGHHATDITANDWDILFTGSKTMNGVQTFHNPNVIGLTLHNWAVTDVNRCGFLYSDATGIDIDGWQMNNNTATFDSVASAGDTAAGTIKNCNGHGTSGTLAYGVSPWLSPLLTDGGGNTA